MHFGVVWPAVCYMVCGMTGFLAAATMLFLLCPSLLFLTTFVVRLKVFAKTTSSINNIHPYIFGLRECLRAFDRLT